MLKTISVSIKDKELVKGPWEKFSVESQASLLHPVPLPLGGVVVLGALTISYYSKSDKISIGECVILNPEHMSVAYMTFRPTGAEGGYRELCWESG